MNVLYGVLFSAFCHAILAQTSHLGMYGLINLLYLKADTDLNGIITSSELDSVYNGFDTDKNGRVTRHEFVTLWELITGLPHELASAYFFLADLNADGVIDNKDLSIMYSRFDIDGNGKVSAQEFNRKWQRIYRESPLAVLFGRADANKNEHLDLSEFDHLFSSFDSNHDHSVSKTEFDQGWTHSVFGSITDADIFFRNLDSNHDHAIKTHDMNVLFRRYDANHDHKIDIVELIKMADLLPRSL